MDDLTTILKELTEKGYTNIETYFNDNHELVLYCEGIHNTFTLTLRIDKSYDIAVFKDGGFSGNDSEHFQHGIDGFEVRKEILRA